MFLYHRKWMVSATEYYTDDLTIRQRRRFDHKILNGEAINGSAVIIFHVLLLSISTSASQAKDPSECNFFLSYQQILTFPREGKFNHHMEVSRKGLFRIKFWGYRGFLGEFLGFIIHKVRKQNITIHTTPTHLNSYLCSNNAFKR